MTVRQRRACPALVRERLYPPEWCVESSGDARLMLAGWCRGSGRVPRMASNEELEADVVRLHKQVDALREALGRSSRSRWSSRALTPGGSIRRPTTNCRATPRSARLSCDSTSSARPRAARCMTIPRRTGNAGGSSLGRSALDGRTFAQRGVTLGGRTCQIDGWGLCLRPGHNARRGLGPTAGRLGSA
jgi:hypothetical protein